MGILTQKFLAACAKTDLWESYQEEGQRYKRYPSSKPDFDTTKFHICDFSSKWEWLPRQHFLIKRDKE